jgi:hypothetical protein
MGQVFQCPAGQGAAPDFDHDGLRRALHDL